MTIEILAEGLPVVGFAKIGKPRPVKNRKKQAPEKFDHIELTGLERDDKDALCPDGEAMLELIHSGMRTCGGCARAKQVATMCDLPELAKGLPVEIPVVLPYDDIELDVQNRLAYFKGNTLYCTGTGVTAERRREVGKEKGKDGKMHPTYGPLEGWSPCGQECPDFGDRCKPQVRFQFLLANARTIGGVYEFRTTSWNSLRNLKATLTFIQRRTGGLLADIPLMFTIAERRVGKDARKQMIAHVEFPGTPAELVGHVKELLGVRGPMLREIRSLEAIADRTWDLSPEETADWVSEFHPDATEDDPPEPVVTTEGAQAPACEHGEKAEVEGATVCTKCGEVLAQADADPQAPAEGFAVCGKPNADGTVMCKGPPDHEGNCIFEGESDGVERLDGDDLHELWTACCTQAEKLGKPGTKMAKDVLRLTLAYFGVDRSADLPKDKLHDAIDYSTEVKP